MLVDLGVFALGWLVAQWVFAGFEQHVPAWKRVLKFALVGVVLAIVHWGLGRAVYYVLLAVMTLVIAVLHGYWFHYRHGIHWRTAEPRDKYLELIGKKLGA